MWQPPTWWCCERPILLVILSLIQCGNPKHVVVVRGLFSSNILSLIQCGKRKPGEATVPWCRHDFHLLRTSDLVIMVMMRVMKVMIMMMMRVMKMMMMRVMMMMTDIDLRPRWGCVGWHSDRWQELRELPLPWWWWWWSIRCWWWWKWWWWRW